MAKIAVARGTQARTIDWSAAVWAGVIAGIVFVVLEMIMAPMFTGAPSVWAPPRMIAAIGMGKDVLPPPASFDFGVVMVAMMIHFATSILFAIVTTFLIRNLGTGAAVLVAIVMALLLYVFVFYVMTPIWPWFSNARNWVSIFAHIVFGTIVGWWYKARAKPSDVHRVAG